jgi:hypothetical protein
VRATIHTGRRTQSTEVLKVSDAANRTSDRSGGDDLGCVQLGGQRMRAQRLHRIVP